MQGRNEHSWEKKLRVAFEASFFEKINRRNSLNAQHWTQIYKDIHQGNQQVSRK